MGKSNIGSPGAHIYALSVKLYKSKEVDLSVAERTFILDRVGKVYPALVYGRISDIFEGDDNNKGDEA